MAAIAKLKDMGWYLTTSGIEECSAENENAPINKITEIAKDTDLKDIGERWLPADVNRGKCEYVQGPGVLQIQKIRNVTAPKDNEESNYAPRMLKLVLTDGQATCNALEMEKLERISLDTPPGSKICLKGKVEVEHGFLKLYNRNVNFIGGRVDRIADNWELKKKLSKQTRVYVGSEGGPPPFIPFGQKPRDNKSTTVKKETQNFKSLEVSTKEKKSEDDEFEQQRKATIAEALQAKEEGKAMNFGGQKQMGQDKDVARIVEMGFTTQQANQALKQSNGELGQAINGLLSNDRRSGGEFGGRKDRGGDVKRDIPSREDRRERGGRNNRSRDDVENEESRPSGPTTLFDFLETKIKPSKDEKDTKGKSRGSQPLQSYDYADNRSSDNRSYNNRREPQTKYQDPPPRSGRNDNRANQRRPESRQSDKSNWENKPSYNSDKPSRNNDREKSYNESGKGQAFSVERSNKYENDHRRDGGQQRTSDRGGFNERGNRSDRGGNSEQRPSERGGYNERGNRENRSDRGGNLEQRPSDRGGYNERGNRENKSDRGGNSERYSDGRPKTGYEDKRQGKPKDYQQNRPKSEMSGRDSRQDSSYQNKRNQPPPSIEMYDSNMQYNNQYTMPPASVPQYDPGVPPPPLPQQFNTSVPNQGVYNTTWKRGDRCMAKYWEDNKYYPAVVENYDPRYPTVVVNFPDYGNSEEVRLSDVRPDPQFLESGGSLGPPALPQQYGSSSNSQIQTMEFHRKRPDQTDRQQKFYQPPNRQPLH
ncbi:tudor domain-containing protein 3-like isoform X2 [Saccostrea echinata]|uniref:tudor domain-containing protein 3-like isoform X2 n=1 Tax=Saccostrea echinata TaxID=191078 RepID=UPI002A80317F|nr:tudor domain-containing protein 3-like isoform X2 [Saccostrea echinata]